MHIVHEVLATKDVGEEAHMILNVRATLGADHLLPILVIDACRFCEIVLSRLSSAQLALSSGLLVQIGMS